MSLKELPKVLVTLLDSVSSEYELSSWYTRGGSDYTTISLRFDHAAMMENTVETAKYKRVSKRHMHRDRDRVATWKSHQNDMDISCQETQTGNDPYEGHIKDIAIQTAADDITPILPAQYDQHDHVNLTNTKHSSMSDLDNIPIADVGAVSMADEIKTENRMNVIQGSVYCKQIGEVLQAAASSIADMSDDLDTSSDDSAELNDPIDVKCDICLKSCNKEGNKWFKCTVCEDFDICPKCHSMKQHMKHWRHIHTFEYPTNCNNGYCDSCGFMFRPHCSTFYVHRCKICQDYAICKKCNEQGMHIKHAYMLEETPARDYLAYLQGRGDHHGDDGGGG